MQIAIIGFGGMAHYHTEILKSVKDIKVTKVFDIDENRLKFAEELGMKPCLNVEEIYNDADIDMILIATPNDNHFEYAKNGMLSGKDVLLEKPATPTSSEFKELMEISRLQKVRLTVHQNRRFDNDYLAICDIVRSGRLGDVYRLESNVTAANGIPGAWRKEAKRGGGMILDWGVHLVDQMVTLYGQNIESVYCRNSYVYGEEVDDGFYAELKFFGGVTCCVTVDTNSFITKPRWQVFGYNGTGEISNWNEPLKVVVPKTENAHANDGIKAGNGFTKTMAPRNGSTVFTENMELQNIPHEIFYNKLMLAEGEFIEMQSVLYTLQVLEAMEKSSRENRIIKMEDII